MPRLQNIMFIVLLACVTFPLCAKEHADIIVAKDGSGNFQSIQQAIDSVPANSQRLWIILVKKGLYNEKLFIRKSNIALVGEDRSTTRIVYAELREAWTKEHNGNDMGSAVINIDTTANDIILANLTVLNNYGALYGAYSKHQFTIFGTGTRTILLSCNIISDGGDALSLWNKQNGMYYHNDCSFEGWVDYVCPRGWCYVTNCQFFGHNKPSASIWHDGSSDKNQKFVIMNSSFDGVSGFPLGRNHLDAQIYLVNCRFSANMADRAFYRPPSSPHEWVWGDRHYFYNCHRDGGDFEWFKDNLDKAEQNPKPENITAKWTFDTRWDPEATMPAVLPFVSIPDPKNTAELTSRIDSLRWIGGRNAVSYNVYVGADTTLTFIGNQKNTSCPAGNLELNKTYSWRVDAVTDVDTVKGTTWKFTIKASK